MLRRGVVTGWGLEEVLADLDHKSGGRAITLASLLSTSLEVFRAADDGSSPSIMTMIMA